MILIQDYEIDDDSDGMIAATIFGSSDEGEFRVSVEIDTDESTIEVEVIEGDIEEDKVKKPILKRLRRDGHLDDMEESDDEISDQFQDSESDVTG
jgi:hypothetical protein